MGPVVVEDSVIGQKVPSSSKEGVLGAGPRWWQMICVLAAFVLIGHIWGVNTGLYLDDYAHVEHLKQGDWSYHSAVNASRLGIVGEVLDLWGRQEAGLRFYRPVAFWVMRGEYEMVGWRASPMHLFSLGWHFLCAILVTALAMRCLGSRVPATVAGCLMAVHPGHAGTVYWVACQTELLTTVLLLAGVLAYARHAGWGYCECSSGDENESPRYLRRSWFGPVGQTVSAGNWRSRVVSWGAVVAIVCYGLALGCRENAILFPVVCWLGDRLIGTPRRRWIRWEHVALGLVAATYLALRWQALGGFPVPPAPYLMPISLTAKFFGYLLYKLGIYTLGLVWFVPVVPMGSRPFFESRPDMFFGLVAAAWLLFLVVWAAYRFRRALLWPLVWTACFIAPVMAVFASPHHLYLPGASVPVLFAASVGALAGPVGAVRRLACLRRRLAIGMTAILGATLCLLAWCMGFTFSRGVLTEDLVVRDVVAADRPLRPGDHLFFINLPVLAYYVVPAIEEELEIDGLRGHVLTFGTDLIRMHKASSVEVVDAHTLRIRAPEGEPYLAGITGRMLMGVMGMSHVLKQGVPIQAEEFSVTPIEMDGEGIAELEFHFQRPLDERDYHFYLGSPQFMAYPLDMGRLVRAASVPAGPG